MRWLLALAVVLTVIPVASARVPNACTLLTRSQAEAALGTKLQWSQRQGDKLASICTFHGEPYNPSGYAQPTMTLMVAQSTPARFRKSFNSTMSGVRVPGIGDSAYATGGQLRALNVLSSGHAVTVFIPEEKNLKWAKTVASEALARLKA